MGIDLTGKSWATKTTDRMTTEELGDAADTYRAAGGPLNGNVANSYDRAWEDRHGLPHADD